MIGEIRDFETAEIGIKAALTGHLVLSTLHTNDAPSTITRLLNMGVEPFLVTAAVQLVQAQRSAAQDLQQLQATHPNAQGRTQDARASDEENRHGRMSAGAGCQVCGMTGYKGRVALYEVMPFTDPLKELCCKGRQP
jgi:type IV pilus assembly protein PilB